MICSNDPFGLYKGDCFDKVILIAGIVYENVHFELIVRDKLSS